MTASKGIILVHLPKIISHYFVVVAKRGKPAPFLASILADGDDHALAHLERLTPLVFNDVNAAIAAETEMPSAAATSSGVT
jgi:hypothetical protein